MKRTLRSREKERCVLINELAVTTGMTAHAIRFYEKLGLLAKGSVTRGENNYRHYSDAAIARIAMIKSLQAAGFALSEIQGLMTRWDAGKLTAREGDAFIRKKMDDIDAKIAELRRSRGFLRTMMEMHKKKESGKGRHTNSSVLPAQAS
jgi:DNA-binding transcriptional MerR regulator